MQASIEAIRIASHGAATRVVIDLSDPVTTATSASASRRVWRSICPKSTGPSTMRKAVGLIKLPVRARTGVSRIVLDAQPFEIDRVFELPPSGTRGHRIVTDLIELPVNGQRLHVNGVITAAAARPAPAAAMVVVRPPEQADAARRGTHRRDRSRTWRRRPWRYRQHDQYSREGSRSAHGLALRRQLEATGATR